MTRLHFHGGAHDGHVEDTDVPAYASASAIFIDKEGRWWENLYVVSSRSDDGTEAHYTLRTTIDYGEKMRQNAERLRAEGYEFDIIKGWHKP